MARETPQKTVPELVEYPLSNLCVTSIGAAIFIWTLNHADVIWDQSDAVTQNAWFRCALCAAISGEISTGAESWGRFPVPRICRWESMAVSAARKHLKPHVSYSPPSRYKMHKLKAQTYREETVDKMLHHHCHWLKQPTQNY